MVKLVDKQTAFNTGIITNKLQGRDDLKQYPYAVHDAVNFIASKYGPMIKRVGSRYIMDALEGANTKIRLVPFVYSLKQTYLLLFVPDYMYVMTFDGLSFRPVYTSPTSQNIYRLKTGFTEYDVENMSYVQQGSYIYVALPKREGTIQGQVPRIITAGTASNIYLDNWSIHLLNEKDANGVTKYFEDGPYDDTNYSTTKKVTPSATTTGSITVTLSGISADQTWVGRHIRMNHPEETTLEDRWGWGVITAVNSETSITVYMMQKAWATTATNEFRLGAWYGTNWPQLVTVHEQRLCWAGKTQYPWLWMSSSFNFFNFAPTDYNGNVKDTCGIFYNMAMDQESHLKWMASLGSLILGTDLYEMRMYSSGAALAPGDCVVRKESTYGAHDALPVITDDTLIFIQRLQRSLRSISYDYTRNAYIGPELSVLAESLTVYGMKKIVYQREPNATIWVLLKNGKLLALTYDKEQAITAWTRVEFGGEDAKVIDLCSLTSVSYMQDMLFVVIERKINGTTKRYYEMLSRELLDNVELKNVSYLDCSSRHTRADGAEFNIVAGLNRLEGETVRVIDEGALVGDFQVKDGTIELPKYIKDAWIGLPYEASFQTLQRDFGDKQISTKMGKVRIHRLVLYLLRTLGLEVRQLSRGIKTKLITFSPKAKMDTPPEPISGEHEIDVLTAWTSSDMTYSLEFMSMPGLPCTIAGVYIGIEVNAL